MRLSFSAKGDVLAGSSQKGIILWNTRTWAKQRVVPGPYGILSPTGKVLACGADNDQVQLRNTRAGELLWTLPGRGTAMVFSPDGQILARSKTDGSVELWNVTGRRLLRVIPPFDYGHKDGHGDEINEVPHILFSSNGKWLALLGHYTLPTLPDLGKIAMIRLWDVRTGSFGRTLIGKGEILPPLAFSPDGRTCAARGTSPTYEENPDATNTEVDFILYTDAVLLWDVQSGEPKGAIQRNLHSTKAIMFTADSKRLITSGDSGVDVWSAATHQWLGGMREDMNAVALSPDGVMLVGAKRTSRHTTIKVWQLR